MKLSEAIRVGSKLRGQATYVLAHKTCDGQITTCAMGAAYEALFGELPELDQRYVGVPFGTRTDYARLQDTFPFLSVESEEGIETPGGQPAKTIQSAIAYMNDYEDMPREEIADWLEARGY